MVNIESMESSETQKSKEATLTKQTPSEDSPKVNAIRMLWSTNRQDTLSSESPNISPQEKKHTLSTSMDQVEWEKQQQSSSSSDDVESDSMSKEQVTNGTMDTMDTPSKSSTNSQHASPSAHSYNLEPPPFEIKGGTVANEVELSLSLQQTWDQMSNILKLERNAPLDGRLTVDGYRINLEWNAPEYMGYLKTPVTVQTQNLLTNDRSCLIGLKQDSDNTSSSNTLFRKG